jgi:hypothetical protein
MNKTPGNEDDHYSGEYQPIDFIRDNGLSFNLGSIIKYLCRHKKKGGRLDLQKAEWYIRRTIRPWRHTGPVGPSLDLLSESQGLSSDEECIVRSIQMYSFTHATSHLELALEAIKRVMESEYPENTTCAPAGQVVDCASER